jgi:hypothetical protein
MKNVKVVGPLTFALALSAAASDSVMAAVSPLELLRPGSLLNAIGDPVTGGQSTDVRSDQGTKRRVVQGCWYGSWRRC